MAKKMAEKTKGKIRRRSSSLSGTVTQHRDAAKRAYERSLRLSNAADGHIEMGRAGSVGLNCVSALNHLILAYGSLDSGHTHFGGQAGRAAAVDMTREGAAASISFAKTIRDFRTHCVKGGK